MYFPVHIARDSNAKKFEELNLNPIFRHINVSGTVTVAYIDKNCTLPSLRYKKYCNCDAFMDATPTSKLPPLAQISQINLFHGQLCIFRFFFEKSYHALLSVPITVLSYSSPMLCGFNVLIKGLKVIFIYLKPSNLHRHTHLTVILGFTGTYIKTHRLRCGYYGDTRFYC